jgi:Flp pilus assembly protein TadD
LSPDNVAAQINCAFNQDLQAHKPVAIQSAQQIEARLGKRRSWSQILDTDGSIDEPNACYKVGTMFAEASLPRQAAQQFARGQTLAPGLPDVALRLAEQLVHLADATNALAAANQALQSKPLDPDALFWKSRSLILLKDYEGAIPVLNQSLTTQTNFRTAMILGFAHAQLGNLDAARQAYERAAQSPTNAYQAYFNLAQVAYLQKDTNAAIQYVELYRSSTPPNLPEARLLDADLAKLGVPTVGASKP